MCIGRGGGGFGGLGQSILSAYISRKKKEEEDADKERKNPKEDKVLGSRKEKTQRREGKRKKANTPKKARDGSERAKLTLNIGPTPTDSGQVG